MKKGDNNDDSYFGSQKNIQPAFNATFEKSRAGSAKGSKTMESMGASGFSKKQEEELEMLRSSLLQNNNTMKRFEI